LSSTTRFSEERIHNEHENYHPPHGLRGRRRAARRLRYPAGHQHRCWNGRWRGCRRGHRRNLRRRQGRGDRRGGGCGDGRHRGYNWQAIHNKLSGATKGTGTQITEQPDGSLKLNIPSSVTFDTNSYAVKPSFAPVLDQLTQTMQQNPELIAQVIGYTDSTGQPAYNQTLSVNRAESVTGYLGQRGVAPQRLSATGMGQNQPVADNNTEAGRAANRRVEIYLRATAQHATQ
jgi:outer membrane protein OmpA-like peptidoglycan-associated protein